MKVLLQLFRAGNALMGIVGLMMGVLIATGTSIIDHWEAMLFASITVFFFVGGGNSLNDYTDREVDKVAHPDRPIPSGRIEPRRVLYLSSTCFAIALLASLMLNLESIVIVGIAIVLMMAYEIRLKKSGLTGNLGIAVLTGMLFLLGGAIVGHMEKTYIIAIMAALATLGREIVKDIEDMEGDVDRRTLPKRIGVRNAGILASMAFLVAVSLSPIPFLSDIFGIWYLAVVTLADATFIYCSIVHFRNPTKGQRLAKTGMLIALIAFLVGGLL